MLFGAPARRTSLAAAGVNLVLALILCAIYGKPFSFTMFQVMPSLDLKFLVGLDGLSLMMVLLTSDRHAERRLGDAEGRARRERVLCLPAVHLGGCVGAFVSFDLFFLLRVPRTGADPDIPADRHLGTRREPGGRRVEDHDLPRGGQLHSVARPDRLVRQSAAGRPHVRSHANWRRSTIRSRGAQNWIFPLVLVGFGIADLAVPVPHLGSLGLRRCARHPPPCCTRAC